MDPYAKHAVEQLTWRLKPPFSGMTSRHFAHPNQNGSVKNRMTCLFRFMDYKQ
jgi:hypothetical protein